MGFQDWWNSTEFFPSEQPPQVPNAAGATMDKLAPQRAAAAGPDGTLRSDYKDLEPYLPPEVLKGYGAIEDMTRRRLQETMKGPQMTNGEKLFGALQSIGGVVGYAQGNPQFGAYALGNNSLTQHQQAAQKHREQMNNLSGELALKTMGNFDQYYTGDLTERRKLRLQAKQQVMALEAEKIPVPPHLYEAAGMKPSTTPIQPPQQPPAGPQAAPQGVPPSGPQPSAPPPDQISGGPGMDPSGRFALPPDMTAQNPMPPTPPMATGSAPAPVQQSAPQPTRLQAAQNTPEVQDALRRAKTAYITGNEKMGDLYMKEVERLGKLTDDDREIMRGMDDPAYMEALLGKARAGSSAPQTKYAALIEEKLAEDFINSQSAGATAQQAVANLNVMKEAIANPDVYMGTGGEQVQAVKKAAQDLLGIDMRGVADAAIIQRTATEMALDLKDKLPGPMSDGDRKFLANIPPNLADDPESAKRLVALGIAKREYQIELADAARQYADTHGGKLDTGWFKVKAEIGAKHAASMTPLVRALREGVQEPRRSPAAGTNWLSIRQQYQGLE